MKKSRSLALVSVLAALAIGSGAQADSPYPIPEATQQANRAKVTAAAKAAPGWKGGPVAACTVEAMSGILRTPDLFPADGDFTRPLRFVAARNEFEPASFLLFAFDDLEKVQVTAGDLVSKDGARIPASALDLTVVKIWYQSGTAWSGFHSDHTRRIPTPELLLHDETLVKVDHEAKENFLRSDYESGESRYRWISFNGPVCDYNFQIVRHAWVHDAKALQPVVLQKNAFKQFLATFHAPKTAAPGLYRGTITIAVAGRKAIDLPVEARVLPFELPRPATLRDLDREFYASAFLGYMELTDAPAMAKNLAEHNLLNPLLPQIPDEESADALAKALIDSGLSTNVLFSVLPPADVTTSFPLEKDDKQYEKHHARIHEATNVMARLRARLGKDVKSYAYGIDEGGARTVRAERATWQALQAMGGKVQATVRFHRYLLFSLDCALPQMQPSPLRKQNADLLHDANEDVLVGWYGDPHSGPENPDYTRRLYGWNTWRNNYDMFCQYVLFRNDWTEFFTPWEPFERGLMLCYSQDKDILDTLAWEGLREGVDDIRYATLLRKLSRHAIDTSKEMETVYAARAAMTWVAQVDFERSSLRYLRDEMIHRILDLRTRLAKEGK